MRIFNNKIYFGDISAEEIADKYESPVYLYDYSMIIQRWKRLNNSLKWEKSKIYYACKANTNLEILKIFRKLKCGLDTVSPGEIYLGLKAGFKPGNILFTGTNVSRDDLEFTINNGVVVNIDNLSMLDRYADLLTNKSVCIRINPGINTGGHAYLATGHYDSKFGITHSEIPLFRKIAAKLNIQVIGVHQHIGSDVTNIKHFIQSVKILLDVAKEFDRLRFINIGGGFKVKYYESDRETNVELLGSNLTKMFNKFCREYGRKLDLITEPGKYLVSESGYLLCTVQSVKKVKKGKIFIGTDTGMNHLIRPALYGAYHEIINASGVIGKRKKVDVVGNICESSDVLGNSILLSEVKEGDVLCVKNTGAYGYTMASNYNSRCLPAELMLRDGKIKVIRKRQSLEDL